MTTTISPAELRSELAQFTGSENHYFHPLYREMTYTDGVKYLATAVGAYWLLDKIGTEIEPRQRTGEFDYFVTVTLKVSDNSAILLVTDGNNQPYMDQVIEYTDFPEGTWSLWLIDGVLILPSEY